MKAGYYFGRFAEKRATNGLWPTLVDVARFAKIRAGYVIKTSRLRGSRSRPARAIKLALPVQTHSASISFVVPVYDREEMLIECVRSIEAENYSPTEILLVLDGSPAGTRAVARRLADANPKIRVIELPTQSGNAVIGRNIGISEAAGEFIFFLDSDDLCLPGRIAATLTEFTEGVDVVYGGYRLNFIDSPEKSHSVVPAHINFELVSNINPIANSTTAVRRKAFQRHGALKREIAYREDHELWLRLCYNGCVFRCINAEIAEIRIHGNNNEAKFKEKDEVFLDLVRKSFHIPGPKPCRIVFVLPGLGISGGIYVVLRHANALAERGYDVAVLSMGSEDLSTWYPHTSQVRITHDRAILDRADIAVATGWQTAAMVMGSCASHKFYFVQSDETRFVEDAIGKATVRETYSYPMIYLTEARWIVRWLRSQFGWPSHYVPNGVDPELFSLQQAPLVARGNRPRVLLEGPIVIPWKGVADAYEAVKDLDCEIWVASSAGRPPENWTAVTRTFEKVPMDKMAELYRSCDIFVKMSRVEGFAGPPLEAMACGCAVIVSDVTGIDEYMRHGQNGLVAPMQDISAVREHVRSLLLNPDLRERLARGGLDTVKQWTWERSFAAMHELVASVLV